MSIYLSIDLLEDNFRRIQRDDRHVTSRHSYILKLLVLFFFFLVDHLFITCYIFHIIQNIFVYEFEYLDSLKGKRRITQKHSQGIRSVTVCFGDVAAVVLREADTVDTNREIKNGILEQERRENRVCA